MRTSLMRACLSTVRCGRLNMARWSCTLHFWAPCCSSSCLPVFFMQLPFPDRNGTDKLCLPRCVIVIQSTWAAWAWMRARAAASSSAVVLPAALWVLHLAQLELPLLEQQLAKRSRPLSSHGCRRTGWVQMVCGAAVHELLVPPGNWVGAPR